MTEDNLAESYSLSLDMKISEFSELISKIKDEQSTNLNAEELYNRMSDILYVISDYYNIFDSEKILQICELEFAIRRHLLPKETEN